MLVQNSIVQTYAREKNKDVTSQEFLDYINQLKEQNPDFKFSQGETKVFESEEQALASLAEQKQAIDTSIGNYKQAVKDRERAYEEAKASVKAQNEQIKQDNAEWFAQEKDLVGIKKDKNSSIEYTLFYSNNGSLSEIIKLKYSIPITIEIDKQMIDGYIYSISDLLTYNAPCKVEK